MAGGRLFIEGLRTNPEVAFGLTEPQWIGLGLIASGLGLWLHYRNERLDPSQLQLFAKEILEAETATAAAPSAKVREHARRLLLRHPLRAADALQLAAALTWALDRPREHALCTLDTRLAEAAKGEGFRLALE